MRSLLRLIVVPAACLSLVVTVTALPFDRDAADFLIAVGLAALIVWLVLCEALGSVVQGPYRRLGAIVDPNFAKYGFDVNLHRGLGY